MALSINLTRLRKQSDYFNYRETGHDNSSIDEIEDILYRTNKHGLFIHASIDWLWIILPNILELFSYCVLSIFNNWFSQRI